MEKKLTLKQEKFCQEYITTGNASEAYRRSYNISNMKPESIHRKATELMANVNVAARIAELKEELGNKFEITKEKLGKLLLNRVMIVEEMQQLAQKDDLTLDEELKYNRLLQLVKASDANKAIDQLSKMFGLNEPDRAEVEHKGITLNIIKPLKDGDNI
jgi:phage terminase small subunit